MAVIAKWLWHIHTFAYIGDSWVPDRWLGSPDDRDMYLLSPGRDPECLTDDRNRQTTSKYTYFHLEETLGAWQMAGTARQPRHIHTFPSKRLWVPDRWQESSDDLEIYILSPRTDSGCLTDGRNRQTTSTYTYFHLEETLSAWQMTGISSQLWYLHTFIRGYILSGPFVSFTLITWSVSGHSTTFLTVEYKINYKIKTLVRKNMFIVSLFFHSGVQYNGACLRFMWCLRASEVLLRKLISESVCVA